MGRLAKSRAPRTRVARRRHRRYYERFNTSSFAEDAADGDNIAGEDPIVRQAAIDALGNMNGTVVAVDPNTGRILAMVNQELGVVGRRNALFHDQIIRGVNRAERRHYHQGHQDQPRRRIQNESYRRPGALE